MLSATPAVGLLLTETVHASSLCHHLKRTLSSWKKPFAVHDPAKTLLDLAITPALGGDALSDSTAPQGEPDLYGPVASKATIGRRDASHCAPGASSSGSTAAL